MAREDDLIAREDARIRHADTQATGIMAFTATAVGLALTAVSDLGAVTRYVLPLALLGTFLSATAARLVDVFDFLAPHAGKPKAERATWLRTSAGRASVAYRKGRLIGVSLIGLVVAVTCAALDVFW